MRSPPTLGIQLLGRFAVVLPDGQRAGPFARPTARRLVQLLCLRPDRRIGREELAEILFPELAPARAANGVAKALSMARSAIGAVGGRHVPALEADRTSIWLSDQVAVQIDLDDHRAALHDALAVPPGDVRDAALTAAVANDATLLPDEPYADWAGQARDALAELRLTARLELARNRTDGHGRADRAAAIDAWNEVAARQPASEEAAIALMRAHLAARQRDRAIRAYVQCVRALQDELDVGPSPELEAAYAELVGGSRGQAAQPSVDPIPERPLFGRDRVRSRVRRRLARTPAGGGSALLLVGPTGIGKSSLLGALTAELAAAGWTVMSGRSVPDDRRAPYAALRQALAPVIARGGVSQLLGKALDVGTASTVTGEPEPTEGDRLRLAEEVAALLDWEAASHPLALALDDVQWADPAMLALLRRLASGCDAASQSSSAATSSARRRRSPSVGS
ncbi:MAG TPA: AAA family ATPase, partial [Candidatus Limnocylindria bacterium]|nr:AAA family ATPase [Candidatus Limnocylindria bacterium]